MPVTVVAGVQWGDEGKGRVVDLLALDADIVVRCQGGPNAGHTVVNDRGKFVLHSIPSGIFSEKARCVVGAGTVFSPGGLVKEMRGLIDAGVDVGRLIISDRAHMIMPYHKLIDRLEDESRGEKRIGTTGQGIGPAYSDKITRSGFRAGDLLDLAALRENLADILPTKNRILEALYNYAPVSEDEIMAEIEAAAEMLAPHILDTTPVFAEAMDADESIVLEGQLGVMRDLDWGAYPFVTSSSPIPAGMAAGAGIPPGRIGRTIGVVKAYTTAVGTGPFPTELPGPEGELLRARGGEYGATTGRPRRCGWFDAVAVNWAVKVGGFTELALTKIDVLDGLPVLPVCTGYRDGDRVYDTMVQTRVMGRVTPIYNEMAGWSETTSSARSMDDLPAAARQYVDELERLSGAPVKLVSVGPERHSAISRDV